MNRIAHGIPFVFFSIVSTACVNAQLPPEALPANEQDALIMLRNGQLDSALWFAVRDYYANPLSVPDGDGRVLNSLFPGSLSDIPADPEILSRFEPWSGEQIARFFTEYPELVPVKPILSFKKSCVGTHARIGCSMLTDGDSTFTAASHFLCNAGKTLSVRGDVKMSQVSAFWQRRTIRYSSRDLGSVTVGNFSIDVDHGLTYGYFPATGPHAQGLDDWRYGQNAGWNGILYENAILPSLHGQVFFHERPTERISGAQGIVTIARRCKLTLGGSRVLVFPADTAPAYGFSYAHTGLTAHVRSFEAEIHASINCRKREDVPVLVRVRQSVGTASIEAAAARIPIDAVGFSGLGNLAFGRSRGNGAGEGRGNVWSVQCGMPIFAYVNSLCGFKRFTGTEKSASECFVELAGSGAVEFDARYKYNRPDDSLGTLHGLTASATRMITKMCRSSIRCRISEREGSPVTGFGKFSFRFLVSSRFECGPFIGWYNGANNRKQGTLGFTYSLHCSGGSLGELSVEIPVVSTFSDWGSVNAKANFDF